jgi:hypothetical protein
VLAQVLEGGHGAPAVGLPGSSGEARVIDVDDVLPPVGERGLPFPMR